MDVANYVSSPTNNCASTVLSAFQKAVDEYGLPSRVRTDRGGENVLVSQFVRASSKRS